MKKILAVLISLALIFLGMPSHAYVPKYHEEEVFNNSDAIMIISDYETGQILEGNKAALKFYGYSEAELKRMKLENICAANTHDETKHKKSYALFKHQLKNGDIKDVEIYSSESIDYSGKRVLISIVHDVTKQLEAERDLQKTRNVANMVALGLILLLGIAIFTILKSKKKMERAKQRLQDIFDNMDEGFALHEVICDSSGNPRDYKFIKVNRAFEKMTGLSESHILNKTVREIMPGTEQSWIDRYGQVAMTGNTTSFENYSQILSKYFKINVYSHEPNKFATIFSDITQFKLLEKKLIKEKEVFRITLHSLGDGVISTDKFGKVDIMNPVAERLTGWTNDQARGSDINNVFSLEDGFTGERVFGLLDKIFETGESFELRENMFLIKKDGSKIPVEDSVSPIFGEKGEVVGAVIVFRDFTEKKKKQDEIAYLSYHDQLTGLYNRRFFEEELKRIDVSRNLPFTVAMADLNGLKLINDAFGHRMGDELLKKVSEILKKECRSDDIVARIGGDEFVILLPRTSEEDAQRVVTRIYKSMEEERVEDNIVSVSMGWSTKNEAHQDIKNVFIKAEEHMYRRKLIESQIMRNNTIKTIVKTLHEKNADEKIHAQKVSIIARSIGEALGFEVNELDEIETAGFMHDIGKIAINDEILKKPEKLTALEYEEVKRHSESGYHILKALDAYASIAEYVLLHHERWDGLGYPKGISGDEIPIVSRIINIADAFVAMTSDRPYRQAMSEEKAIEELKKYSNLQFDENIVNIFIEKCLKKAL